MISELRIKTLGQSSLGFFNDQRGVFVKVSLKEPCSPKGINNLQGKLELNGQI